MHSSYFAPDAQVVAFKSHTMGFVMLCSLKWCVLWSRQFSHCCREVAWPLVEESERKGGSMWRKRENKCGKKEKEMGRKSIHVYLKYKVYNN